MAISPCADFACRVPMHGRITKPRAIRTNDAFTPRKNRMLIRRPNFDFSELMEWSEVEDSSEFEAFKDFLRDAFLGDRRRDVDFTNAGMPKPSKADKNTT